MVLKTRYNGNGKQEKRYEKIYVMVKMTTKTKQTKVYYLKQLTFIKYNPRKALKNNGFVGNRQHNYILCCLFYVFSPIQPGAAPIPVIYRSLPP